MRTQVLAWLDADGVRWKACGPFADPTVMVPWLGEVWLDMPYDEALAEYCRLRDLFRPPRRQHAPCRRAPLRDVAGARQAERRT